MKIIEDKIIETPKPTEVGFKCDFCGKEVRYTDKPHWYPVDGFVFAYRDREEDQIRVEAREMCVECEWDRQEDIQERLKKVVEALKELAPYAQIDAPLWES